ncbi:MAG TPA: hypothetical protein PKZ84_01170 [Anaerolineae bacterium]|nr:hypothetical protein [Anaerolineae bacterium]HQI83008.1 hypothetical protein [Anaerolineae bacterium]
MSRERILQIGIVAALLVAGMLVGWVFKVAPEEATSTAASNVFREWFWEQRSLDLLIQVTLIFVGALGVAAVLPKHEEASPKDVGDNGR